MIVKNPTKNDIEVQIEGIKYLVRGESEIFGVPTSHAEYWKNNLHNFLKISKDTSAKKEIEEAVESEKEEIIEVITTEEESEEEVDSTEDEDSEEESEEVVE